MGLPDDGAQGKRLQRTMAWQVPRELEGRLRVSSRGRTGPFGPSRGRKLDKFDPSPVELSPSAGIGPPRARVAAHTPATVMGTELSSARGSPGAP